MKLQTWLADCNCSSVALSCDTQLTYIHMYISLANSQIIMYVKLNTQAPR